MNRTENVAVHHEFSSHCGRENDSVGFAGRYGYADREVGLYRETVGLRHVLVADEDANHIPLLHSNDRPRIQRRSMAYAIVEP